MIFISHRGNLEGKGGENLENHPDYINKALKEGFDVEIDVWFTDQLYLGHDDPQYLVDKQWLLDRKNRLWIHTKNFAAMDNLIDSDLRLFYHEKENHVAIANTKLVWSHNLQEATEKSVIPLLSLDDIKNWKQKPVYAICSDFVAHFAEAGV
jgi:hypothetical protein